MPKETEYTSGWIDTTIHDFLSAMSASPASRYALITCLDSCFALAPIADANPELQELKRRGKLQVIGDSISLATRDLLAIQRQRGCSSASTNYGSVHMLQNVRSRQTS